ncbi:thioredoxin [Azotobacter chroococcum]
MPFQPTAESSDERNPYIFDVTDASFDQLVLENSFHKPVLVDFWAEWCAPCKALMPLLAKIAESYQGELLLAKVNSDVEQQTVMRMGIRSLPTVVLFRNGQPVDGFAGAQPESAILAMLEPHVQMPAAPEADPMEVALALFAAGQIGETENLLVALLGEDNENGAALILYARCLAERGELSEAETVLDAVKGDEHKQALAGARAQLTFLRQAADLPEVATLKSRLAQDANDDEAAYQLAIQQLARQQYEAALDGLLRLFVRNRSYADGLPHKTLLQVFDLLGSDHPLVATYRRKLYQALY